jgi:hypothetical protein
MPDLGFERVELVPDLGLERVEVGSAFGLNLSKSCFMPMPSSITSPRVAT